MNKNVLGYVNKLEGFKTAIKSLHWNSKNMSQHKLCDDIADRISDFQDQVSEVEQSISGNLPFNELKPTPYTVKDLKTFVKDVISSVKDFMKTLDGDDYIGMKSDCESFLSDMQRNLYLVDFTLKENLKRRIKDEIREDRKQKVLESIDRDGLMLTENELRSIVRGSILKVLNENR